MAEEDHVASNDYNLRIKGPTATSQPQKNINNPSTLGKETKAGKNNTSGKSTPSPTTSSQSFIPLNYDIVEDMKKTKANIILYELA